MKKFIQQQIGKKTNYLKDSDYLLREYKEETETVKGYNGRQLLELLQNCDDQGSTEVLIKLDQENNTISISNNGEPFSEKGYRSLFISYLSSKTSKKEFIGNKGLGFRSIINWSNQIEIESNGISLIYNHQNRKSFFEKHFNKNQREEVLNEEGLIVTAIPVPFLGIPTINSIKEKEYVTSIIITYKEEFFNNIIEQVKSITPETLFFLKNLENIRFEGFEESVTSIETHKEELPVEKDEFAPVQKITYNDTVWYIFKEEESLGEVIRSEKKEEEFYQIKIAIEENMALSDPKLYSFFPTNIQLDQPYILHATFDLDATRNQLVKSKKNSIILEKVVQFTIKVAKYFTQNRVSYKPLEILNHRHEADTLDNLGYYELVNKAFENEKIFPCVDNTYRSLKQVVYFGDGFAKMLKEINATDNIGFHLLESQNIDLSFYSFYNDLFTSFGNIVDVVEVLNTIASKKMPIYKRALFIYEVFKKVSYLETYCKNELNLLVDKDGEIIQGNEFIYTPITKGDELKTPDFADIKFINKTLYNELNKLFEFKSDVGKVKSRVFSDKLNAVFNIQSYEPANLALRIISETKKELASNNKVAAIKIVQEMNKSLFHNFFSHKGETSGSNLPKAIPCISKSRKIINSSSLILSDNYPNGKLNSVIFEGIYKSDNYVCGPKGLGINTHNEEDVFKVQKYLQWLNISETVIYNHQEFNNNGAQEYFNYIYDYEKYGRKTGYHISYTSIIGLDDILKDISLEKLVLWIHKDHKLRTQLNDDRNTDVFSYFYHRSHNVWNKPSFIKYQITTNYKIKFQNLLIDEKYSWVNGIEINYRHKLFLDNGLTRSSIQEILVALGAKDNFNDLPIDKVAQIINMLPEKYPNGEKSSAFYKKALSHFKLNQEPINSPLNLFADDGDKFNVYEQQLVYFSEKIKLPKRLKKDFPIFNFPARSGGADAIRFFGINDLKEVEITIKNVAEEFNTTAAFNNHLSKIKPFILVYRINALEDLASQQNQASICNKIEIKLCSQLEYSVNDKTYEASKYEYIHFKEYTYYIRINPADSLEQLIGNSDFTDNIADIISLSFDVKSDKSDFRNLIRNNIRVAQNDVIRDFGEDTLNEAKELLGLSDFKQAFWKAMFNLKSIEYDESLDDISLNNLIQNKLNIDFDVASLDYDSITSNNQINKLKDLFEILEISLEEFSKVYIYKVSYDREHRKSIKNFILSQKLFVKSAFWNKLKSQSSSEQKSFLTEINQLEDCEKFANDKAEKLVHSFQIDKQALFEEFIKNIYGELSLNGEIDFKEIIDANQSNFSKGELELIKADVELKSLLHFETALEDLKQLALGELDMLDDNSEGYLDQRNAPVLIDGIKLGSSDNLKEKVKKKRKAVKRKPYLPKQKENTKLKEIGDASEECAMKYLKDNNFSNIYKASDDNEGLHYDIRYTDDYGTIKYIEVKTFNNSMFHLSKDEFEFGKENQEDYEIWLVKNNEEVIPIKDFYTNTKYNPIASEYEVYLDLEIN